MTYLFAAYGICWALTFVFLFSMASRQKRLERELQALRQALGEEKQHSDGAPEAPGAGS